MRTSALMYHDLARAGRGPSGFPGAGPQHYAVPWETFLAHLDAIGATLRGAPAVLDASQPGRHDGACVLTFDDGGTSAIDAAEELRRRGWRAYFFITSRLVGTPGFVDRAAVAELDRMGHVVGSHSVTHPDRMGALSFDDVLREWRESCDALADVIGHPVGSASVPGGYYRRHVAVAAARAGITTLFTSEPVRDVASVDGCLVVGRYAIRSDTPAEEAAAAARGDRTTWRRQYVSWTVRKPAKVVGGPAYDRVRRALLARRARHAAR